MVYISHFSEKIWLIPSIQDHRCRRSRLLSIDRRDLTVGLKLNKIDMIVGKYGRLSAAQTSVIHTLRWGMLGMLRMSEEKLGMLRNFFAFKIPIEICIFATINHQISFKIAAFRFKFDQKTLLTNTLRPDFSFFN